MTPEKRTAVIRWILGLVALAATVTLWPDWAGLGLIARLLIASMALLIALTHNLGVRTEIGESTFVPVTVLMGYMALGREAGWIILVAGLLVGGIARQARRYRRDQMPWWQHAGAVLFPIGQNGLSFLAADWAYRTLGGSPPLMAIRSLQDLSPPVIAPVIFLIAYNVLLILDLALQGVPVVPALRRNLRALLAVELLPMALAPFSALALFALGVFAFLLSEIVLLTIAIVVNRLTIAQESLQHQVQRLRSFSAVSRSLRTSLDVDSLLETVYLQVANLLEVRNLHVLLGSPENLQIRFAVEGGRRARYEPPFRPDDFARWVIREHLPLLAESVKEKAAELGLERPPQARVWMGAPLMASNRVLGCMYTWLEPGEQLERLFTGEDLDTFTTIAVQAAVGLENALLYEQAQKHAAQLARLNQISALLNASLNPEHVLELIADSAIEVAGCDRAAIYLLETDDEEPSLLLAHVRGFSPEHIVRSRDIAVPMSDAEREKVMREGQVIAVPDLHAPDAEITPATLLLAEREHFSAYAYLPLSAQKNPIGMLAVYYDEPHHFSEGELELLETFANQAALAVINARIYQRVDIQLARRVEQAMRLADINHRLSSTLDLQTIFDLIIDSAMDACDADAGVLVLAGDPEGLGGSARSEAPNMVAWRGFDPASGTRAPHHVAEELANSPVLKSSETVLISTDDPGSPGPRSQLGVPIVLNGRVIGAIALESAMLNAFTEEDARFVGQLAIQAAVAIRNAQLYRRAQIVRDRLHAILDASNDGLLMIDDKSRIVMTNTRMGDFWDFARQDFSPRSPDQIVADPLTALGEGLGYREGELSELLAESIRNPNAKPRTDLYVTRSSEGRRQRFVERTATPVRDEQGNFIGLLLIFRDVTKQKELEEARENLTSMIVHDLRSPLQAVMGGMRVIGERVGKDDPVIEQATEVSGRAIKKLLNLVNNLLDLSRLESGEFTPDTSVVSIPAILEDAAQELMPLAREMDAIIRVECPPDLPESEVDRDMIERVVLNLVDNALKYSPPGSVVTLRADVIPAEKAGGEAMIRVQVADRGPGIPDEFKRRIFDRFSQVPGHKGRRRSAGLGLAFCRMAVRAHGGNIWVEDNPGGGSIFGFTLPISHAPARAEDLEAAGGTDKKADKGKKEKKSASPASSHRLEAQAGEQAARKEKPAPEKKADGQGSGHGKSEKQSSRRAKTKEDPPPEEEPPRER